jgi:hypothetical protein
MDPSEFDRLIARAQNPRLIPGIYNYCDSRCHRCPFNDRCLTHIENRAMETQRGDRTDTPIIDVGASLQRTIEVIAEAARRKGIDLDSLAEIDEDDSIDPDPEAHRQDPLAIQAREYGQLAWRITNALGPVVEARGDPLVIDAVETIGWFSSLISAKISRAVFGLAESSADDEDIQTDYDGSAKVALIGIEESRAAWTVLMEHGKATADGVPAQAVRLLGALDEAVRARFPLALQFVRPGFDEPDIAAGAQATLPPFARRRRL